MNWQVMKNKIGKHLDKYKDYLFIAVLAIFVLLKLYCAYSMIMFKLNI